MAALAVRDSRPASFRRACEGVDLVHPVIILAAALWLTSRMFRVESAAWLNQEEAPYSATGWQKDLYRAEREDLYRAEREASESL